MKRARTRAAILLTAVAVGGCQANPVTDPDLELTGTWYAQETSEIAWNMELQELPGDSLTGTGWYGAPSVKRSALRVEGIRDGDKVRLLMNRACCALVTFEGVVIGLGTLSGTMLEEGRGNPTQLEFARVWE